MTAVLHLDAHLWRPAGAESADVKTGHTCCGTVRRLAVRLSCALTRGRSVALLGTASSLRLAALPADGGEMMKDSALSAAVAAGRALVALAVGVWRATAVIAGAVPIARVVDWAVVPPAVAPIGGDCVDLA